MALLLAGLARALEYRGLRVERQANRAIEYQGEKFEEEFRADLVVEEIPSAP